MWIALLGHTWAWMLSTVNSIQFAESNAWMIQGSQAVQNFFFITFSFKGVRLSKNTFSFFHQT
jgi:hypothetical protein